MSAVAVKRNHQEYWTGGSPEKPLVEFPSKRCRKLDPPDVAYHASPEYRHHRSPHRRRKVLPAGCPFVARTEPQPVEAFLPPRAAKRARRQQQQRVLSVHGQQPSPQCKDGLGILGHQARCAVLEKTAEEGIAASTHEVAGGGGVSSVEGVAHSDGATHAFSVSSGGCVHGAPPSHHQKRQQGQHTERQPKLLFTHEEVREIVERAVRDREHSLSLEFMAILEEKLQEQFAQFSKFNQDHIHSKMSQSSFSYMS